METRGSHETHEMRATLSSEEGHRRRSLELGESYPSCKVSRKFSRQSGTVGTQIRWIWSLRITGCGCHFGLAFRAQVLTSGHPKQSRLLRGLTHAASHFDNMCPKLRSQNAQNHCAGPRKEPHFAQKNPIFGRTQKSSNYCVFFVTFFRPAQPP